MLLHIFSQVCITDRDTDTHMLTHTNTQSHGDKKVYVILLCWVFILVECKKEVPADDCRTFRIVVGHKAHQAGYQNTHVNLIHVKPKACGLNLDCNIVLILNIFLQRKVCV